MPPATAAEPTAPDPEVEPRPVLGFIVNPIAGMGGAVALKGTDDILEEARRRGAEPVAHSRAVRFLERLGAEARILTCSDPMGAGACREAGRDHEVLVDVEAPTSAQDTQRAARRMVEAGVDLLVFLGGDGTALDVAEAIDHGVPVLGVPSGVKMNSAVFAQTPEAASVVADAFLAGHADVGPAEVVEVDEDAMRQEGLFPTQLGSLLTPIHEAVQASKAEPGGTLEGVVEAAQELATPGSTLVLGPGSTMLAVKQALAGEGTLLGVDVLEVPTDDEPHVTERDATAEELERVPADARILVSPIGGQGFVLGRGNQQLVPALLARLGWDRLVVLATAEKLRGLDALHVDTGDRGLDEASPAHLDVLTGPGFRTRLPLRTGAQADRSDGY